jgi:hypothetical protein
MGRCPICRTLTSNGYCRNCGRVASIKPKSKSEITGWARLRGEALYKAFNEYYDLTPIEAAI